MDIKKEKEKLAKDLNKHFTEKGIQMANKYIKRCSALLVIRPKHSETTLQYQNIPVEWLKQKSHETQSDEE